MAKMPKLHGDARGFTLTEVMITLVIFSIVMAISFPMLAEANRTQRLSAAAGRVETAIMRARALAVTEQTPVRISFSAATNSLQLDQDTDRDGTFDKLLRVVNIDNDVAFADIAFGGGTAVVFDQRGAPDNPGTILLGNGGDSAQRVLVSAGSGAVSVSAVPYGDEGSYPSTQTP